jgi:DNA gyrase subunit A
MSVLISRALPDARDGLKPSQRRILLAMHDMGLGPAAATSKCAGIIGETMKRYHPHGDQSIYMTLVRMAQDWNMRHTLIHPQGNFGSIAGLPPAAHRYTEARLTSVGAEMLGDLERDTVDFIDNYDGKYREPLVLPSKFPNLLVNGSDGIAVGMATEIPPHNLREVADALIRLIDEPEATIEDLMEIIPGPDFPTGGVIHGRQGLYEGYMTGRGKITLRARASINTEGNRDQIIIHEVPYQQTRNRLHEAIGELIKDERIKGIADMKDESSARQGEPVRLVIYLKRDADPELILNQLYQFSPLEKTVSLILLALVDGRPRMLNLKEMLQEFLRHRVQVIRRRTEFLLREAKRRAHVLEGQLIAISSLDEVIRICRNSPSRAEAKQRLQDLAVAAAVLERALGAEHFRALQQEIGTHAEYHMTEAQAEAVVRMQLGQLATLERDEIVKEYNGLRTEIISYEQLLSSEANILAVVRQEQTELRDKYGEDRRTEIVQEEIGEFRREDLPGGGQCRHHQPQRLCQTTPPQHLSQPAPRRPRRHGRHDQGGRLHRACVRCLHARLPALLHEHGADLLAQGLQHSGDEADQRRPRHRQCPEPQAGGESHQPDSGPAIRTRLSSADGHARRPGEEDTAGRLFPTQKRRHYWH